MKNFTSELAPIEELEVHVRSTHNTIMHDRVRPVPVALSLAIFAKCAARLICTGPTDLQDPALGFFLKKLNQYMAEARGELKIDMGFPALDNSIKPMKMEDLQEGQKGQEGQNR